MNSNLYKEAAKLCKFMKKMAGIQQKHKLTRIRIEVIHNEFPISEMELKEKNKCYNYCIKRKITAIAYAFTRGYRHFRDENFGKPDNSIHIRFIMKKAENEKIIIDKSELLNKEIKIYVYIKDNEINYNNNIIGFVNRFVNNNFQLLLDNESKEEYKKVVDSERYTREEIKKLYNLKNY